MNKLLQGIKKINSIDFSKEQIINFLLHIVVIIVPFIIFDFDLLGINKDVSKGHSQYLEGKVFFLLLIGILLIILGIMTLRKINLPNIISLIFLLTIFIASVFSDYKYVAFIGSPNRGEGFFMIFVYVIIFILASHYFKPGKITIRIIFISSVLMSLIALIQFLGFDLVAYILKFSQPAIHDAVGTLGNRNFMGTYTLIFLILSMSIYIFKGKKEYLVYAVFNFIGLMSSLTRGCWIAFIIVSIIGTFFIIKRKDCLKRVLLLVSALLVMFVGINLITGNKVIDRCSINNIVEDGKLVNSANAREQIFNVSLRAFCEKPFLGTGPDTLKLRLEDDFTKEYYEYLLNEKEYIDKAHNEFLEYAVSDGIFTVIAYVALLVVIIIGLIKNKKDDINKVLLLVIIGYILQSILNISTVGVAQIFWIILGYAICRNNKQGLEEK